MSHWNVVVNVRGRGDFSAAKRLLRSVGDVERSEFYNVLLMEVPEPREVLEALAERERRQPGRLALLSRVTPVTRTFSFQSAPEFDTRAREALTDLVPSLAGKSFHVRLHRRGFRGRLSSVEEEQALDAFLLEQLRLAGTPGSISFEHPDAVVVIETVGPRAGVALETREDLERHPFLSPD